MLVCLSTPGQSPKAIYQNITNPRSKVLIFSTSTPPQTVGFWSLPLALGQPSLLLGHLLAPRNLRLDADAAKHEPDAEPLHVREAVAKGDDAEDHGEHLARDGHGDEQHRGEGREGVDLVLELAALWERGRERRTGRGKERKGKGMKKTHR